VFCLMTRSAAERYVAENDTFRQHVAEIAKQRHVIFTPIMIPNASHLTLEENCDFGEGAAHGNVEGGVDAGLSLPDRPFSRTNVPLFLISCHATENPRATRSSPVSSSQPWRSTGQIRTTPSGIGRGCRGDDEIRTGVVGIPCHSTSTVGLRTVCGGSWKQYANRRRTL